MKRIIPVITSLILFIWPVTAQIKENTEKGILFRGLVMDASNLTPVPNSQIFINKEMAAVTGSDGAFVFYVNRSDTVVFNSLGYKQTYFYVSDTLSGTEFNAGIFMRTDTVEIGEVIIIPRRQDLRSDIMRPRRYEPSIMDNARSNVAISAYQGRVSQSQLGDPIDNYAVLSQKQKTMAFEKGGIPSDQMVGLNPFIIVPAAYLLIKGFPDKPASIKAELTSSEVEEIHRKYLERNRAKR